MVLKGIFLSLVLLLIKVTSANDCYSLRYPIQFGDTGGDTTVVAALYHGSALIVAGNSLATNIMAAGS